MEFKRIALPLKMREAHSEVQRGDDKLSPGRLSKIRMFFAQTFVLDLQVIQRFQHAAHARMAA